MDIARIKRLSGINENWKEVEFDDNTAKSSKASKAKTKENNKDVKNKSIDNASTDDTKMQAELIDTDDSSITPEEGKFDASGQIAPGKVERQYHTVVIDDNGAPKVADTTEIETFVSNKYSESHIVDEFNTPIMEQNVSVAFTNLSEDMRSEITQKLEAGEKIQLALEYNDQLFSGYLTAVNDQSIQLRPTSSTAERHNIQEESVTVSMNVETLKWSSKHANRLLGQMEKMNETNHILSGWKSKPLTEMAKEIRNRT